MYLQKFPFSNFWYLYVHIYCFSFLQLIYLFRKCFNMLFISIYMINTWYNWAIFQFSSAIDFSKYLVISLPDKYTKQKRVRFEHDRLNDNLYKCQQHGPQIFLPPLVCHDCILLHISGLVVKALDSQSRSPMFKTIGCFQGRLSLPSFRGRWNE